MFTRNGGWRLEEIQVLLAQVRSEILSNKSHLYTKWSVSRNEETPERCLFKKQYLHHSAEAYLNEMIASAAASLNCISARANSAYEPHVNKSNPGAAPDSKQKDA
jgi:hypothetical protein